MNVNDPNKLLPAEKRLALKSRLSPKEKMVLHAASFGKSTVEMAEEFGVSESTIETHRKSILKKLQVKNMIHAVAHGLRNQLIE